MDQLMIRVVNALCEDVGTPRALAVKLLANAGEWTQLLKLRTDSRMYDNAEAYFSDNLVTEFLRKCKLPAGIDTAKAALDSFWSCEAQNAKTNLRLSRFIRDTLFLECDQDERVYQFITEWRKMIAGVLGNLPLSLTPRFSAGATYADSGMLITIPDKMSSTPTICGPSRALLPFWWPTAWARGLLYERPWSSDPKTVRGNKFFTVPKDGEKDRGCCKEPSINVCFQLDVGREIRSRLKRIGIDLLSGQQRHRNLACQGSQRGHLATIDMSNASDTICRLIPKLVLPGPWYELLNSLRSPFTQLPTGKWVRLEKFSSMGNGYTFELETLVFSTLARTIVLLEGGDPDVVTCYGDDLIIPTANVPGVLRALAFFGFTPNEKKTFVEGPFRESCGGDFFQGEPVRAHYLKELPDEPQQWIALANGLRRAAFQQAPFEDPRFEHRCRVRFMLVKRAWFRCLEALPSDIRRCRGPEHLGDLVIQDDEDHWELGAPRNTDASHEHRYVRAYVPVYSRLDWHHWTPLVQLASCTLGLPSSGVTPRGAVTGYRVRWTSTLSGSWQPTT